MEETNNKPKIGQKQIMAALAYLGPLVFVPFLTTKNDPFVKFHIKQGFVVLVVYAVAWLIEDYIGRVMFLATILRVGAMILSVVGIVWVFRNKEKKLPIIGEYASYFDF